MKAKIRSFVMRTAETNLFWLYRPLQAALLAGKVYEIAKLHREAQEKRREILATLFPDFTVRHGPFQGLRYVQQASSGSHFFPKLLGSYEAELQPILATILTSDYDSIVDVGCAEGYYAVGLALKFPQAKIFAFDAEPLAQQLCAEMAALNGVSDRVSVGAYCDAEKLCSLPLGKNALIISDCEGYEQELFTSLAASFLAPHDILIEVHDLWEETIKSTLQSRFAASHDITVVESIDDAKKVRIYRYPELEGCDAETKMAILAEHRRCVMDWLFLTPKSRS